MIVKMKKGFMTMILLLVVGFLGINWISLPSLADFANCTSGECNCSCKGTECSCSSGQGNCSCSCVVGNYKNCISSAEQ